MQHLRGDRVVAQVVAVAEGQVGLVRVQAASWERVGVQLGVEADAAALLTQVEQVAAGSRDAPDRLVELRPAVTTSTAEDVSGEALAVDADQGRRPQVGGRQVAAGAAAETQSEVLATVDEPVEGQDSRSGREAVGQAQRRLQLVVIVAAGGRWLIGPPPAQKRGESA